MHNKIKVLYIAGNGRSGSTILNIILGQVDGFFAVGELRRIWDRGFIENRPCGCGKPFNDCEVWENIFQTAVGGRDQVDPHKMVAVREKYTQTKHLPSMLIENNSQESFPEDLKEYMDTLEALYPAIQKVTNCEVIVDSSKWPMYAHIVNKLPSIDLYIVHLIRDPRAYCFSFQRRKEYEPGKLLPVQSAIKSLSYWITWNPSIKYLWNHTGKNYLFFPYEQFAAHPHDAISSIINFVCDDEKHLSFIDDHTVKVSRTHAVAGNVARLTEGEVKIRLDDEWKSKMPVVKRALITASVFPLMYRYGYLGSKRN